MGDIEKEILGQKVNQNENQVGANSWQPVKRQELPTKAGFWNKFKAFWLQEINVELTPMEQKIEDNLNAFLNQEVTFKGIKNFLFQEIKF